ncbi:MAG: hypothetical protein RLZZ41_790 [Actinomycetota bacterium]
MTNSFGDQSRQDLEDRLNRILKSSDAETKSTGQEKPFNPVVASSVPVTRVESELPAAKVEPVVISKKSPAKPIGSYVKAAGEYFTKVSKTVRAWVMTIVKRPKRSTTEKRQSAIGKFLSDSKKLAGFRVNKKVVIAASGLTVILAIGLTLVMSLSYVTVGDGIETNLGSSVDRTVLTLKASEANQGDLLVASLGLDNETNEEILIMGTVFSKNDQTYALYDGEVIWQITAEQIRGKVLFAEATETP